MDAVNIPEAFAKKVAEALNSSFEASNQATAKQMSDCRDQMAVLDANQDKIFDMFTENEIDRADFERQTMRIKNARKELLLKLEQFQSIINGAQMETSRSIIELAISAKSLWKQGTPMERRNILELLLSNRSLDGLTVRYDLKKPFVILAEMARKQDWRSLVPVLREELSIECNLI